MFVKSALCLLVVLTCYRDVSVLAAIGNPCLQSADCSPVNNTVCVDQVCTCTNNFVPDSASTQCLPKVGHNESCSESIQCDGLVAAECVSNICQCTSSFNFNGVRCVGNNVLGQQCIRDVECVVPDDRSQETVWCFNRQCSCRSGYTRDGDRCVIGGDCQTDNDCLNLTSSRCDTRPRDRHQCVCLETHIAVRNNTRCLPITATIDGGCEFNEQCSPTLGNVVCTDFRCRCAEGSSWMNNVCSGAVRIVLSLSCFVLVWMVKLL